MQQKIILNDIDITPLLKAKEKLDEAVRTARSELEKTGAIKCFEYCYELSWKLMRKILFKRGIETASPREAFREAGANKIIDDVELWFDFITKRNLTSHTYDEELADEVFKFLPTFQKAVNTFILNATNMKS